MKNTKLMVICSILFIILYFQPALPFHSAAQVESGAGIKVNLDIPADIPLKISGVRTKPSPSGLPHITYRLTNAGTSPLAAVEISWVLYFGNGDQKRTVTRADYVFGRDGMIRPQVSDDLDIGSFQSALNGQSKPLSIQSATATITYAQFADGTELGSNARTASAWFAHRRGEWLAVYKQALEAYRLEGTSGLAQVLDAAHLPPTAYGRDAWMNLNGILKKNGTAAVVAELNRIVSLKLPGGT
jgi:hypothetical protein